MAASDEKERQSILALLISNTKEMTLRQLSRDFREQCGYDIPYAKFGHKSLLDYLRSIPVVTLKDSSPNPVILPRVTEKSSHIDKLVVKQRTQPSRRGGFHQMDRRRSQSNVSQKNSRTLSDLRCRSRKKPTISRTPQTNVHADVQDLHRNFKLSVSLVKTNLINQNSLEKSSAENVSSSLQAPQTVGKVLDKKNINHQANTRNFPREQPSYVSKPTFTTSSPKIPSLLDLDIQPPESRNNQGIHENQSWNYQGPIFRLPPNPHIHNNYHPNWNNPYVDNNTEPYIAFRVNHPNWNNPYVDNNMEHYISFPVNNFNGMLPFHVEQRQQNFQNPYNQRPVRGNSILNPPLLEDPEFGRAPRFFQGNAPPRRSYSRPPSSFASPAKPLQNLPSSKPDDGPSTLPKQISKVAEVMESLRIQKSENVESWVQKQDYDNNIYMPAGAESSSSSMISSRKGNRSSSGSSHGKSFVGSHRDEEENSPISDRMKDNFRKLLRKHPNGFLCSDLPNLYQREYNASLDHLSYGYNSMIQMVSDHPKIFSYSRTGKTGDWLLSTPDAFSNKKNESPTDDPLCLRWVPKQIIQNIRRLLQKFPKGLPLNHFLEKYEEFENDTFDFSKFGYPSVQAVVDDMKNDIHQRRVGNEILLYLLKKEHKDDGPAARITDIPAIPDSLRLNVLHKSSYPDECCGPDDVIPNQPIPTLAENGRYIEVRLSEITNPEIMWLHLGESFHKLNEMMEDLHEFYENYESNYVMPDVTIQPSQLCACVFSEGGKWHRIIILARYNSSEVHVEYIDYGTKAYVRKSIVRFLHKDFTELPAQAIKCKLVAVQPPPGCKGWPLRSSEYLYTLTVKKRLVFEVHGYNQKEHCISGLLIDTSGTEDVVINDELVSSGHASYIDYGNEESEIDSSTNNDVSPHHIAADLSESTECHRQFKTFVQGLEKSSSSSAGSGSKYYDAYSNFKNSSPVSSVTTNVTSTVFSTSPVNSNPDSMFSRISTPSSLPQMAFGSGDQINISRPPSSPGSVLSPSTSLNNLGGSRFPSPDLILPRSSPHRSPCGSPPSSRFIPIHSDYMTRQTRLPFTSVPIPKSSSLSSATNSSYDPLPTSLYPSTPKPVPIPHSGKRPPPGFGLITGRGNPKPAVPQPIPANMVPQAQWNTLGQIGDTTPFAPQLVPSAVMMDTLPYWTQPMSTIPAYPYQVGMSGMSQMMFNNLMLSHLLTNQQATSETPSNVPINRPEAFKTNSPMTTPAATFSNTSQVAGCGESKTCPDPTYVEELRSEQIVQSPVKSTKSQNVSTETDFSELTPKKEALLPSKMISSSSSLLSLDTDLSQVSEDVICAENSISEIDRQPMSKSKKKRLRRALAKKNESESTETPKDITSNSTTALSSISSSTEKIFDSNQNEKWKWTGPGNLQTGGKIASAVNEPVVESWEELISSEPDTEKEGENLIKSEPIKNEIKKPQTKITSKKNKKHRSERKKKDLELQKGIPEQLIIPKPYPLESPVPTLRRPKSIILGMIEVTSCEADKTDKQAKESSKDDEKCIEGTTNLDNETRVDICDNCLDSNEKSNLIVSSEQVTDTTQISNSVESTTKENDSPKSDVKLNLSGRKSVEISPVDDELTFTNENCDDKSLTYDECDKTLIQSNNDNNSELKSSSNFAAETPVVDNHQLTDTIVCNSSENEEKPDNLKLKMIKDWKLLDRLNAKLVAEAPTGKVNRSPQSSPSIGESSGDIMDKILKSMSKRSDFSGIVEAEIKKSKTTEAVHTKVIEDKTIHIFCYNKQPVVATDELIILFTRFTKRHAVNKALDFKQAVRPYFDISIKNEAELFKTLENFKLEGISNREESFPDKISILPLTKVPDMLSNLGTSESIVDSFKDLHEEFEKL